MSEPPDSTALAERFLRLWEESWQQIAADPQVARYWGDLFASLQHAVAGGLAADAAPAPASCEHAEHARQTNRPPTAAAAPVDGGDRVGELERRVSELERRVADLAAAVERQRRRPGR